MTDAATIAFFTPPGHFMCCICFETFPVEQAWKDRKGQAWDMCKDDGWEIEDEQVAQATGAEAQG